MARAHEPVSILPSGFSSPMSSLLASATTSATGNSNISTSSINFDGLAAAAAYADNYYNLAAHSPFEQAPLVPYQQPHDLILAQQDPVNTIFNLIFASIVRQQANSVMDTSE